MSVRAVSSAIVAFAASVAAQTFTDCNPLEKTCPADPALGNEEIHCDYTQGECPHLYNLAGTTIAYDAQGALFSIANDAQAPTIASDKFIFFGRLEVELLASPGAGVVTSVVLQSKDLDEIDWEWVGGDNAQVQSNYFGKGDTSTYDRGAFHPVAEPLTTFHTYAIEWTSKKVDWIIDGAVVRTLLYEDAQGGARYPQTPMEVKLGTWVAGLPSNAKGTIEWAGGLTDFSQAPFNAWYKSVSFVDYAGGDAPTSESIKEYIYGDNSGSWESIQVVKGDGSQQIKDVKKKVTKEDTVKVAKVDEEKTAKADEEKSSESDEEKADKAEKQKAAKEEKEKEKEKETKADEEAEAKADKKEKAKAEKEEAEAEEKKAAADDEEKVTKSMPSPTAPLVAASPIIFVAAEAQNGTMTGTSTSAVPEDTNVAEAAAATAAVSFFALAIAAFSAVLL